MMAFAPRCVHRFRIVDNFPSNLANTASLLWHAYKSLPERSGQVNWAGTEIIKEVR